MAFRRDPLCLENCRTCVDTGEPFLDCRQPCPLGQDCSRCQAPSIMGTFPGCTGPSCNEGFGCLDDCIDMAVRGRSRTTCAMGTSTQSCSTVQSETCRRACTPSPSTFCNNACTGGSLSACTDTCARDVCPDNQHCGAFRSDCRNRAAACPQDCPQAASIASGASRASSPSMATRPTWPTT